MRFNGTDVHYIIQRYVQHTITSISTQIYALLFLVQQPPVGYGLLIREVF